MKAKIENGRLGENARHVDIYNDGLTVFLYDRANEEKIRQADPKIIWFAGTESFEDTATKNLLAAGDLLVYGLHGDGGVNVEIYVGEIPTAEELDFAVWFEPQEGFLHLPSGNLCVHSYNTLPMGDNGDEPLDEGAVVEVPPGFYKVTLYRMDLMEMEEAEIDLDLNEPDEIIVLTPVERQPAPANILFRDCIE